MTAGGALLPLGCLLWPGLAHAQLRPLDPADWSAFESDEPVRFELGAVLLNGQRASLAGVEGRLWELGVVELAWRTGRVVLEAAGTIYRVLEKEAPFIAACCDTQEGAEGAHKDVGDFRIATSVHILRGPLLRTALRFGTRLPTTDNRVGLERDRTDFFALIGAQTRWRGMALSAEAGLGVYGTREADLEQSDVLLYSAELRRRFGMLEPSLAIVGQADGLHGRTIRGNEDLQEARVGLRAGSRQWVEVELIRGFRDFSPRSGFRLGMGARR